MLHGFLRLSLVSLALSLAACGGSTAGRVGFIPRSVPMMEAKGDEHTSQFKAKGFKLADYGKVSVESVSVSRQVDVELKPEDFEDLRTRFQKSLQAALEKAGGTGDRTLVVRGEITAIKPNKPMLNVAPQTQLLKRGYGYAACEIFATDGLGGAVVAAWMNTMDTQRFGAEKLSELGTARKACEAWGPAFRTFLAE
ncbi:MAG: DUF3313 family protein [Planctomycetes bacterium]|nr:DUF3313 family protein [Planctomycetota bacterium]